MNITTTGITTQVTTHLREMIVSGEYEPGKKLSEITLAKEFGVSRTPIREALKQLDREGLVDIIPRVGTCVAKPTEKDLHELFAVKEVMEGLGARLLVEEDDSKKIEQLENTVMKMEKAVANEDEKLYVEANNEFHTIIIEGANNEKLKFLLNLLMNQMPYRQYVHLSIQVPSRLEESLKEHQEVLTAIKAKDAIEAEKLMKHHVKASMKQLQRGISQKLFNSE